MIDMGLNGYIGNLSEMKRPMDKWIDEWITGRRYYSQHDEQMDTVKGKQAYATLSWNFASCQTSSW